MGEIDLYYWPTPNGWKITIALEEMGLPYRVRLVHIGAGDQFAPEFLAIAPNNRIPAIVDPDGPDGRPISVFESGAILQYLARKTGKFHGATERERVEVDQWLFWQMGGVGPMAGQANHFLRYAPSLDPSQDLPYANRYRREVGRLYGVLDRRLADREFVAGPFLSIADMAIWPWAQGWQAQESDGVFMECSWCLGFVARRYWPAEQSFGTLWAPVLNVRADPKAQHGKCPVEWRKAGAGRHRQGPGLARGQPVGRPPGGQGARACASRDPGNAGARRTVSRKRRLVAAGARDRRNGRDGRPATQHRWLRRDAGQPVRRAELIRRRRIAGTLRGRAACVVE